jgi:hypothetical protein
MTTTPSPDNDPQELARRLAAGETLRLSSSFTATPELPDDLIHFRLEETLTDMRVKVQQAGSVMGDVVLTRKDLIWDHPEDPDEPSKLRPIVEGEEPDLVEFAMETTVSRL